MITLEEKLKEFDEIVSAKVEREIKDKINKKNNEIQNFLDEEKAKLEIAVGREKRAAFSRIDRQKLEKISTLEQEQKRRYLRKNEEFTLDLIQKVESKGRNFALSDEYSDFMKKLLEVTLKNDEISKDKHLTLKICPTKYDNIKNVYETVLKTGGYKNFKIEEGNIDYIGGFIIEISEDDVRINKTLSRAMEVMHNQIGEYLNAYVKEGASVNG